MDKKTGSRVRRSPSIFQIEVEATLALCESVGTPRALTVALLIKYSEWHQLLDLKCDPNHYDNPDAFAFDYQVTSVLQKNPRIPAFTPDVRRATAIEKWHKAEQQCRSTNERIMRLREQRDFPDVRSLKRIQRIQEIVQRILGPVPTFTDLQYCESNMRFGPGATTSTRSGIVTLGSKFDNSELHGTPNMVYFRAFCFPDLWKRTATAIKVVGHSKLTTVPKNAKVDRVICIEPDLNIFVQLGIGALLRDKLRKFGLPLNTQLRNQELSRKALDLGLATVDLSSASDTIAREVVSLLLPPQWVSLLEFARVPATKLPDGSVVELEKWSSMGNGYTFELETLIFYATAIAATEESEGHKHNRALLDRIGCYGDDIIVPASAFPVLREYLNFLGFSVNEDKSFGSGLFYESCGTDWFKGHNVRPVFFRSEHHDLPTQCYINANNLRRWANRRNGGYTCDSRVLPAWLRWFTSCPAEHRHRIPEGFGDCGFVTDFDRATPDRICKRTGGYVFTYRRIANVERVVSLLGAFIASLSKTSGSNWTFGREALRGRPTRARKARGLSHDWPNLGPWV